MNIELEFFVHCGGGWGSVAVVAVGGGVGDSVLVGHLAGGWDVNESVPCK